MFTGNRAGRKSAFISVILCASVWSWGPGVQGLEQKASAGNPNFLAGHFSTPRLPCDLLPTAPAPVHGTGERPGGGGRELAWKDTNIFPSVSCGAKPGSNFSREAQRCVTLTVGVFGGSVWRCQGPGMCALPFAVLQQRIGSAKMSEGCKHFSPKIRDRKMWAHQNSS